MGLRGEVFSSKAHTPKRTYFFNVKENRNGDIYLNIVETKKQESGNFERHQVVLFKEDMESFMRALEEAIRFMREGKA